MRTATESSWPAARLPEYAAAFRRAVIHLILVLGLLHGFLALYEQTVQYFDLGDSVGFLREKQKVVHLPHWRTAFYVHVFTSIFSLCAGFTQFLPVRGIWRSLHRMAGRLYVFNTLLLAAPSGLILALNAEGGTTGRIGFTLLTVLWFGTTLLGMRAILRREVRPHVEWMIRSYALTFSAVTLREWQFWFMILLPPTIHTYPITAWLGWVPNLLVAELWLRSRRKAG